MLRSGKLPLFACPLFANPRGYAAGVTSQIEPCIIALLSFSSYLITKYFEGFPQI